MKCFVEVYGCTANKSDAYIIKGLIKHHFSHELVDNVESADILIILTCTVIDTTEQRLLHRIKVLYETGKNLVIAGCMASVQQDILAEKFPQAVLVPPRKIHHLFEIVEGNELNDDLNIKSEISKNYDDLTAPIMIAEGCLFSCHYCITHLARGPLHSYPSNDIFNQVREAIDQGCYEIQLTAQDTASYGLDKKTTLPDLLRKIVTLEGEYMIRIGMMNPRTTIQIKHDLSHLFQDDHIYSFLHLPIQSGDNIILEKMNRGYTIEEVNGIIKTCRHENPELTLSTDVIVGYPGETKNQYEKTKRMLEKIEPDIVNITRFSARPKTKAKTMEDRIPTEIVKERSRDITKFCQRLMIERNKKNVGRVMDVISMKKGDEKSILCRSKNYKPVVIKKPLSLKEKYTVEIIDTTETHLVGMLK